MNKTTTQYTAKLVRDLQVGDVIHCEDFGFNPAETSHVTIKGIFAYGTSFHSLTITGEQLWKYDQFDKRQSYVFDKMTKVRIVNPQH